jgi:putative CocE/NonD family hydrolase
MAEAADYESELRDLLEEHRTDRPEGFTAEELLQLIPDMPASDLRATVGRLVDEGEVRYVGDGAGSYRIGLTDAPDTDFAAKLVDVHPDGYAANLCDGFLRASHRDGDTPPARTETGLAFEYAINLWATSNRFKAGHRLRVEVSSSNFPRFDRNPNTGAPPAAASELRPARQTVFHTAGRPSRLVLPVIP